MDNKFTTPPPKKELMELLKTLIPTITAESYHLDDSESTTGYRYRYKPARYEIFREIFHINRYEQHEIKKITKMFKRYLADVDINKIDYYITECDLINCIMYNSFQKRDIEDSYLCEPIIKYNANGLNLYRIRNDLCQFDELKKAEEYVKEHFFKDNCLEFKSAIKHINSKPCPQDYKHPFTVGCTIHEIYNIPYTFMKQSYILLKFILKNKTKLISH